LRAAQRATTLTHQLHLFSGREPARPEVVDIAELMRELEPTLRLACGDKVGLELTLALDRPEAEIDPMDFEAALLALVGNARDALPDGGQVSIALSNRELAPAELPPASRLKPGPYIEILVRDGGLGMTSEVLARAFDPFFSTKESGAGSGLGLTQAYGFALQAGGHIEIESASGRGTSVRLLLPSAQSDGTSAGAAQP